MRKILLLIAATLFAGGLWAYNYNYRITDTVPEVGHYTWDRQFDQETNTLSFVDRYRYGNAENRKYIVHVYERKPGQSHIIMAYRENDPSEYWFHYGVMTTSGISENEIGSVTYINDMEFSTDPEGHTGGPVGMSLTDVITKAKEQNYTELRIVIEELTRPNVMWDWYPVETESTSDRGRGLFHNNYLDVDLDVIQDLSISVTNLHMHHGDNFQVTGTYQASHAATLTIQYTTDNTNWTNLAQRTLTDKEAKEGYEFTYKRALVENGMDAERTYRVRAFDPIRQKYYYSPTRTVSFFYDYEDPSGSHSYKQPGTTVSLSAPASGQEYQIISDIPTEVQNEGSSWFFIMPACNAKVVDVNKTYTVRFFDYDHTLLKTEYVNEGQNATPPTPSHPGMTFIGWDGSYINVRGDRDLHALYEEEGNNSQLSVVDDINYVTPGDKITLNIYVRTGSAVATAAYIQSAWLDKEGDALNWETSSNTAASFTTAQSQAGTTKTKEVTLLSTGSSDYGHRARYLRLKVQIGTGSSATYIYSNTIRIETGYPINVYSADYEDIQASAYKPGETWRTGIVGNGTLFSRPLDTIWMFHKDYTQWINGEGCPLHFQLASGTPVATGHSAHGYWLVLPEGYGPNTVTVTNQKYTVLFYCSEHFDGYWRTIYGDGVYEPQEIPCGGSATPPDVESELPAGKIFRGWQRRATYFGGNSAYLCVSQDMAFDAVLETVETFTVTFKDWDGTVLATQEVNIGASAMPPVVENRYGYDFIGWDKAFDAITANLVVTAQYESWPENIELREDQKSQLGSRKFLHEGILMIERNGRIYTIEGTEVK